MQQLSKTNSSSVRIQQNKVGSIAASKLQTKVPSMWRFLILPNRLSPTGSAADSALRLRLDSAHGVAPSLGELNWRADVGMPIDIDLPACSSFECCSATSVSVATATIDSQPAPARQAKSDEAFGDRYRTMLAEAAHDIRAPLGVARQILARIVSRVRKDGTLSSQDMRLLDSADDRLQQATTWVDGILLPNRLQHKHAGTMRQRFYPHQLRGIVEPMVSALAGERDIALDWVGWDRSLPRLYLDSNQLGRVLLNLINNAVEASPRGSRLSIRIAWQTNVTQRLVIAIEDEGRGLSAPLLRFINSAQQVAPPSEAGIGLVSVKSLVAAIGGSVSAQVGALGGTLFRVTVPVDNRLSLVRGWLLQQAQFAARDAKKSLASIQLHLLRSSGADTAMVDRNLQQSAAPEDFIYRVSDDRWLWMTIVKKPSAENATSPNAAALKCAAQMVEPNGKLQCQLAAEWINVDLQALHNAANQRNLLPQLSSAIADKFATLAGNRVPPIDQLNANDIAKRKPLARQRDLLRVDETGRNIPSAKLRTTDPARREFESVNLLTADPAIFAELAHDWRLQHSQL